MITNKNYKGVIPAFYACYDDVGRVSTKRCAEFTEYLIEKGVNGLYVCGSSGECVYQSIEERKSTLEAVIKTAAGRIPIIAHVAASSTADSVELAKHAEQCGAAAVAAIPPIFYRLPDYAIADYWNAIANAVSIGFMIYNIPGFSGTALSLPLFREMLKNPKVIAVKNSSPAVQDIQLFKMVGGPDFTVFNGPDEQFVGGRIMGADAGIGGTYGVMPELFLAADKALINGDLALATEIQFALCDIIYGLLGCHGHLYSVVKEVLRHRGMDIGMARPPLSPVTNEDGAGILSIIKKIDTALEKYI